MENKDIKRTVIEKYGKIAKQSKEQNLSSCCGSGGCSTVDHAIFSDNYSSLDGYVPEADLGLGCGLPTQYAGIKPGHTVVDLGSGAGNDCFVARALTGEKGKVIGIELGNEMIALARQNAEKLGLKNVEFRQGDIEKIPMSSGTADVVISNCVLNLVPDKRKAFSEIFRILKAGGHFSISDVVIGGELPAGIRDASEMYVGCVSGALQKEEYLRLIPEAGFSQVTIQKEKRVELPDDILKEYLDEPGIRSFRESGAGIYSITVFAVKDGSSCCTPGSGCC